MLRRYRELADSRLAERIKEICYASWTTEPTTAQNAARALESLARFTPDQRVRAFWAWVTGIASITKGDLAGAVRELDVAEELLRKNDNPIESAQTGVAKLIALAMLGNYEEAIATGMAALRTFTRADDQLAAGKIEMNLSNIFSRQGKHRLAEKHCLSARERFRRIGAVDWQTMAENGLANTYAELNEFSKAERFYQRALASARSAGMRVTEAEIEASMGNLDLYRGRYAEALKSLEQSRRKYEKLKMPHQAAIAELEIADIYAELNLASEAVEIYRSVVPRLSRMKMRAEEARARANYGRAAAALNNVRTSRFQFRKSADLFRREGNPEGEGSVRLAESRQEIAQGNPGPARRAADEAARILGRSENERLKLAAALQQAEALRETDDRAPARRSLKRVLEQAETLDQHSIRLSALNALGKLAEAGGRPTKAESYYRGSVEIIERLRAPLAGEEFQIAFLSDKTEPHENLARLLIDQGRIEEAFTAVERARARVLSENVGGSGGTVSGPGEFNDQLADARERLNWVYKRIDRAAREDISQLQKDARRLEKQVASLTRRINSTERRGAASRGSEVPLHELQKKLGRGRSLIEYVKFGSRFSVFVIDANGIDFVADLASEGEIASLIDGLHFQFGSMRYGGQNLKAFLPELKRRTDVHLKRLHDLLFSPLLEHLGTRSRLVVVPAAALYYLPFQALFDGEAYLIESRELVYSPSAAVWHRLASKRRRSINNAMLMGFADESIPEVDREIFELRSVFPNSRAFTGSESTWRSYAETAPSSDIIHLACHGQFRPDNPTFSSLHLADGWMTVRDVCAKKIDAELVTLSACETGLNKLYAGDEIVGLARGFLTAGASSILLTLWSVNDAASTELMKQFYSGIQRGLGFATSLQSAQVNFIRNGSHPYYWSPFSLLGS